MSLDTEVLIIGGGPSGLGMAIQLIRKLGTRNFTILEKSDDIGGTWHANSYPGCGCDVPSHFYSFSFALNPNWSQTYALQPEIREYFASLAAQYRLPPHVRLNTAVEEASWDAVTGTWLVTARNQTTKKTSQLRCKILVSAVGSLSVPQDCDIPGAETFSGRIFHSARWDHSFDYANKNVVVIGNGCSATQFVPVMSAPGPSSVAHITQFSRQPHWLTPRPNPPYTPAFRALMRWCPLAMRLYRWYLFAAAESGFASFAITSGASARAADTATQTAYIRSHAPAQHAAALVPTTVLGCKRKVMDTDYLHSLHRANVTLIPSDPVARLTPTGVVTASGRAIPADAVVLATGFKTHQPLFPMRVRGERGTLLEEHWRAANAGSPAAYHGTLVAGFPNLFVLMGPNTVSGHLSVLFTTECQIGYVLRVVGPVLEGLREAGGRRGVRGLLGLAARPDVVAVRREAEARFVEWVAERTKGLVWSTGCSSWGVDERTGKNTMMYPDWQVKFWLRSVWVRWGDLVYQRSEVAEERARGRKVWPRYVLLALVAAAVVGGMKAVQMGVLEGAVEVLREAAPKSLSGRV